MFSDLAVYLVIGRDFTGGRDLPRLVAEAVAGGVTLVQLREKEAAPRDFAELARVLKAILTPSRTPLFINDNLEVARKVAAEGIHVGQSDTPVAEIRRLLGPKIRIGLSVETREEVLAAEALDVDYLGVSPVFASASKADTGNPWGLDGLAWVRAHSRHRLVGIGGIAQANAREVIRAGADGVAVISAIGSAPSPGRAAAGLKKAIEAALEERSGRQG
jgi:thiamine-phosphate pyrophosphorylase